MAYFKDANGMSWGSLLSTHEYEGFQVVKVLNATCSGGCYSQGGQPIWLTYMDNEVVGSEPTKRRAKLIGDAIRDGHMDRDGDTGGRLESYLSGLMSWDNEGPAPTNQQQLEINSIWSADR